MGAMKVWGLSSDGVGNIEDKKKERRPKEGEEESVEEKRQRIRVFGKSWWR